MPSNRTYLSLLRNLKSQRSKLLVNPRAYTWNWLDEALNRIYSIRCSRIARKQFNVDGIWDLHPTNMVKVQEQAQREIDEVTVKVIGTKLIPVVKMSCNWWPEDDTKAFWSGATLVFTSKARWDELRTQDYIRWCTDIKDWTSADSFVQLWQLDATQRPFTRVSSTAKGNIKSMCKCPLCQRLWRKTNLADNAQLDEQVCPLCADAVVPNAPHTTQSVFSGYHSHYSGRGGIGAWQFQIQRLKKGDAKTLPMGIEVEMQLRREGGNRRGEEYVAGVTWDLYQKQLAFDPTWNNFYFERDGSLGNGGVEMITNPMTLDFHRQFWDKMLNPIRAQCVGWDTNKHNGNGGQNYGIHITFNKKYWGEYRLARLIKFVENPKNQQFIWSIAQRATMYGGYQLGSGRNPDSGSYGPKPKLTIKDLAILRDKKIVGSSRSRPVHVKANGLVEIRMFRSTLNQVSFMKNFEFLDAFLNWTKETGWSESYLDFLTWLGSKPHHFSRYANLLAYLAKDTFSLWDIGALPNTWKEQVKKRKARKLLQPAEVIPTPVYVDEDA